jgi:hypothetical protein
MALFFLLRVSPTGFTAEVFNEAIGTYVIFSFSSFMAFLLWRSVLLAATERSKRGSVVISHSFCFVMCRITSHICIQTFHFSCLSLEDKTIHTQDFLAPSNSIIILTQQD